VNPHFISKPYAAELFSVSKGYSLGSTKVPVLCDTDLTIYQGEFLVITGPSGCGKSTLLNMLSGIDLPDRGRVVVSGVEINSISDKELTRFRSSNIGFVFQSFNLLPVMTALENVEYPLQLSEPNREKRTQQAISALESVGLAEFANRIPSELSGGQRQRVAIARALVKKPTLIVADEPTANLDRKTGKEIIKLMRDMQSNMGTTFVFSSHDPLLIESADRVVTLVDGTIDELANSAQIYPLTKQV